MVPERNKTVPAPTKMESKAMPAMMDLEFFRRVNLFFIALDVVADSRRATWAAPRHSAVGAKRTGQTGSAGERFAPLFDNAVVGQCVSASMVAASEIVVVIAKG